MLLEQKKFVVVSREGRLDLAEACDTVIGAAGLFCVRHHTTWEAITRNGFTVRRLDLSLSRTVDPVFSPEVWLP